MRSRSCRLGTSHVAREPERPQGACVARYYHQWPTPQILKSREATPYEGFLVDGNLTLITHTHHLSVPIYNLSTPALHRTNTMRLNVLEEPTYTYTLLACTVAVTSTINRPRLPTRRVLSTLLANPNAHAIYLIAVSPYLTPRFLYSRHDCGTATPNRANIFW